MLRSITRVALVATLILPGCAPHPENIQAKYVSPTTYGNLSCEQLADERARTQAEAARVSDIQRGNANADTAMVVGSLFLWPVLFGLAATTDHREEVARMKGEAEATEQELKMKGCTAPATPVEKQHAT